ncbi:alpha/beta hydrolase [Nocardia sp. BMG51109]|uniref:alpha/beta hydrolase n=1 Tax=Nocardia sp. BMG51109 TaxID=1056816 RepID=UPI0004650157|nr:alpha/beta hydrolase [Nocardia sp. BMG51109]
MTDTPRPRRAHSVAADYWRRWTCAQRDQEYSPSLLVADFPGLLDEYATRSARTRQEIPPTVVRYGRRRRDTIDFFPARYPDAPLLVFVHGGYWQQLGKRDASFPAAGLTRAGCAYAALDHGLAPDLDLPAIIDSVRTAIAYLTTHAATWRIQPARIILAGSSAGAYLALTGLLDEWSIDGTRPRERIAGAVLLDGIYDLEPLVGTYINDALGLDAPTARRLSPLDRLPGRLPPTIVARGEHETDAFAWQHARAAAALAPRTSVTDLVVAGRNHFDLVFDLDRPDTVLGHAVFDLLGLRT